MIGDRPDVARKSRRSALMAGALAIALGGCTLPGTDPQPPTEIPDLGWASALAAEPERFQALLSATSREGWVALHASDPVAASAAFADATGPDAQTARQRAALIEATLHDDLQRLVGKAAEQLFAGWQARGALPPGAAEVRLLAARCAGRPPPPELPQDWQQIQGAGAADAAPDPQLAQAAPPGPWRDRLERHAHATAPSELRALVARPVAEMQDRGFERRWFDPCAHATLARLARQELGPDPARTLRDWTDPAASVFAPWLDVEDLRAQLDGNAVDLGAASPRLERALGLPAALADRDEPDQARAEIRAADERLAAARAALLAVASDDGAALITEIGLIERLRAEVLVARARRDLRAGHPHRALATLSLARDVTSREIGPSNGLSLIALLAEANLSAGRAREALDALQILTAARPEARGAQELVGDLSVLRGLDRQGDSKEH